jgi:hypothetical protein
VQCWDWPTTPLEEAEALPPAVVLPRKDAVIDTDPPKLTLFGDGEAGVTANGAGVMVHWVVVGEDWEEPGFEAIDAIDGDLSNAVLVEGYVDTESPTAVTEPLWIRYSVSDTRGNTATAFRQVSILGAV